MLTARVEDMDRILGLELGADGYILKPAVPNIVFAHLSACMRARDVVQTAEPEALARWGNHHKYKLTPEAAARRLKSLSEDSEGFKLFARLEPAPDDLYVRKIMYSAMIPGSSTLPSR